MMPAEPVAASCWRCRFTYTSMACDICEHDHQNWHDTSTYPRCRRGWGQGYENGNGVGDVFIVSVMDVL